MDMLNLECMHLKIDNILSYLHENSLDPLVTHVLQKYYKNFNEAPLLGKGSNI